MADEIFSLGKDETFSLEKPSLVQDMILGCGWKNKIGRNTDIDLSALFFDENGTVIQKASFGNSRRWLLDGSVYHFGDDLTGNDAKTDADNEQIELKLAKLPSNIKHIFAVASLYSGSMANLNSCYVCVRSSTNGPKEINAEMASLKSRGMILAQITRNGDTWDLKNLSLEHNGQVAENFVTPCKNIINGNTPTNTGSAPIVHQSFWQRWLAFFKRIFTS